MVVVSPTSNNTYKLQSPIVTRDAVIESGYETNGANIPRVLWWFVPPFKPKYLKAIIVHDYFCDKELYKKADDLFEELLFEVEKSIYTRAMVMAVRLYHKIRYKV